MDGDGTMSYPPPGSEDESEDSLDSSPDSLDSSPDSPDETGTDMPAESPPADAVGGDFAEGQRTDPPTTPARTSPAVSACRRRQRGPARLRSR